LYNKEDMKFANTLGIPSLEDFTRKSIFGPIKLNGLIIV